MRAGKVFPGIWSGKVETRQTEKSFGARPFKRSAEVVYPDFNISFRKTDS